MKFRIHGKNPRLQFDSLMLERRRGGGSRIWKLETPPTRLGVIAPTQSLDVELDDDIRKKSRDEMNERTNRSWAVELAAIFAIQTKLAPRTSLLKLLNWRLSP